jgi:hypothetical protein
MQTVLDPFRFLLISVAVWMNQQQPFAIDYLREENRVLKEQLGGRRLRLNDDQRRRVAAKAKRLARHSTGPFQRVAGEFFMWLGLPKPARSPRQQKCKPCELGPPAYTLTGSEHTAHSRAVRPKRTT